MKAIAGWLHAAARYAAIVAALAAFAQTAAAQQVLRIAAVVNDDVISAFDLQQRLRMVLLTSGLQDTPEQRQRLAPRVLQILIDERLQAQEAARLNVRVTAQEVDQGMRQIERNNNLPSGGFDAFARQAGVSAAAVEEGMRANIRWQKILARSIVPTIEIGPDEIDTVLERITANSGRTEYRVAEILLPIDDLAEEAEVIGLADRLVAQLREGANFGAVARQFSRSATAAQGGDIGWVQEGQLGAELDAALARMAAGQLSPPIRAPDGIRILALIDRRRAQAPGEDEVEVAVRQLLLPFAAGAAETEIESQIALAVQVGETAESCADFAELADQLGAPQPAEPIRLQVGNLSEQLRDVVAALPVGDVSAPLRMPNGIQLVMLCERDDTATEATRERIGDALRRERLDMLANRYLRDLRRAAFIDRRV